MSWAGIAANQGVSRNNLQDAVNTSVFTLKNTIPAGLKQITKTEAAFYVNIDQGYAPYAAKASNQLVVKSNLIAATPLPYSYTVYYNYDIYDFLHYAGFTTSTAACAASTNYIVVYSNSSSIAAGTEFSLSPYGDDTPGQIFVSYDNPDGYIYFKIGSSYVTFENYDGTYYGHIIRTVGSCGPVYYTYVVRPSNNLGTICTDPSYTVYSSSILLTAGDFIFYDTALTNPVTGFDYVVRASGSPDIYNMNPGTGELTSDTGSDC
jgi:hypothetical protein